MSRALWIALPATGEKMARPAHGEFEPFQIIKGKLMAFTSTQYLPNADRPYARNSQKVAF